MTIPTTLPEAFQHQVRAQPDNVALRTVGGGVSLTWRQYGDEVRRLAGGFAKLGLRRGDTFAAMLANRPEFNLTEMAANHLGATTFSIYNTSSPEQIRYLLEHSDAKVLVTERQFIDAVQESGAAIPHVLIVEEGDLDSLTPAADFDFEAAWRAVQPDDVLCLIYTSGTTGPPKGVEHTHAGFLGMAHAHTRRFPIDSTDTAVSYLPAAHLADRGVLYYFHTVNGAQITTVADIKQLPAALAEVHPTTFAAVPRVWEKLKTGIELQLAANPTLRADFDAGVPEVVDAVRAKLGLDRVKWALSGSAGIPPEVFAFLVKLGIPVTDIRGMSEIGVATAASPAQAKAGTVGTPLPGYEVRLEEDGELLIRAPFMMRGYRNDPAKTAEIIDRDGWLHTGDIFVRDDDGYLTIIDKKKELIINSGGKNMSPSNIEHAISGASPIVGPTFAHGDGRPYNVALITLDWEVAGSLSQEWNLDRDPNALVQDSRIIDMVRNAVAEGNSHLSRIEQIKRFVLLPDRWEPGSDLVTPTGKLKRNLVRDKYAGQIDRLYAADPTPDVHEPSPSVMPAGTPEPPVAQR
ncbi:long-chain fatty acid--CoA ligase [Skermania sp. ID1734]|uniref:AMP-dependent synthetase/ligase n=1 Tax=Skermania sp. ID1734 TaxID=2597516 RepID=UPI00117E2B5D|nr:long-chain fatty acid--CoA ligase [Skermania sp. ID1734]TSE01487.1 long-chain fatty acid--CoA ligase [Skermania sp. ID1734]